MKYTPSALVSEFSGAQGSTVASHNRFGPYFRNRTIPVNPQSAAQTTQRNVLKAASQAWRALSSAQRAAWTAAAALIPRIDPLGRTYFQSGHQFFVSTCIFIKLYDATSAFPTDPSTIITPTDLASATYTCNSGPAAFTVAYTATPLAAATKLLVKASNMVSAGVSFVTPSRRRVIFTSAAAAASPANILAAYNARWGTLVAGKHISCELRVLSSTGGYSNTNIQLITIA